MMGHWQENILPALTLYGFLELLCCNPLSAPTLQSKSQCLIHYLENVYNAKLSLREIWRTLAPEGKLYLIIPKRAIAVIVSPP